MQDDSAQRTHGAYGIAPEDLNIVVVEPARTMQSILRSMLQALRPKRIRMHDNGSVALRDMLAEPPNLLVTDWKMAPVSGHRLVKVVRHKSMAPLCFVPIVVVTGHATRGAVEAAFRTGAHAVMVKPLAPAAMRRRIDWILDDARRLRLDGDQWVIDGVAEVLDEQRERERLPTIIADLEAAEAAEQRLSALNELETAQSLPPASSAAKKSERVDRLLGPRAAGSSAQSRPARPKETLGAITPPKGADRTRWSELWSQ